MRGREEGEREERGRKGKVEEEEYRGHAPLRNHSVLCNHTTHTHTHRKLHAHVFGQMLLHMCVSLFGLYASFLVAQQGAHYTTIPGFCFATSAVLQYFMLVYFFWTAVEAVHLYLKLVRVFGADVRHYVLWASIIAWGMIIYT